MMTSKFQIIAKRFLLIAYHSSRLIYSQFITGMIDVCESEFVEGASAWEKGNYVTKQVGGFFAGIGSFLGGVAATRGGARHPLSVSLKLLEDSDTFGGDIYDTTGDATVEPAASEEGEAEDDDNAEAKQGMADDLEDEGFSLETSVDHELTALLLNDIPHYDYRELLHKI